MGAGSARLVVAIAIIAATTACRAPEPVALWLGGDVHLGERARGGVAGIVGMLDGAAGIVNLEGPIAQGPGGARVEDGVWLANPSDAPAFLHRQGIVAASIANNHADDAGPDGLAHTASALHAGGVAPIGGPAGISTLVGPVPITLIAHDLGEPDLLTALDAELSAPGVQIVSLHVTGPPSYLPRPELEVAVDRAVAAGADVVVAHGTHAVGPVERRTSGEARLGGGTAVIAWGVGNLLFHCPCTDQREAVVLRVELGPDGVGVAEVVPITAGLGGEAATPTTDPDGMLDLLEAIGSSPLVRGQGRASF